MPRLGFAKRQFLQTYQRSPWIDARGKRETAQWPLLDEFLTRKIISYLHYDLAHRLLRNTPSIQQEAALFLCHLTLAAQEGHLCIKLSENELNPTVAQLWQNEEGDSLSDKEADDLTRLIFEGSRQIPSSLVSQPDASTPQTPICKEGNAFYLQRNWFFETLFLKHLMKHLHSPPSLKLDFMKVEQDVRQICQNRLLLKEQGEAILKGCLHPISLLVGGPGTGKTYTAGHLIKVFWENLSDEQQKSCQIVLAAPTGKAAANLQRSISKVFASLDNPPSIESKTLHTLLEIKQNGNSREKIHLKADLIVVDESSMVDIKMMALLFESLKPGSRLILLGDQYQLPSVEAGSAFHDLIALQFSNPLFPLPVTSLSVCMRAELQSLVHFSSLINQGLPNKVISSLNDPHSEGIKRLHLSGEKLTIQKKLVEYAVPQFPKIIKPGETSESLLDLFQSIRLLSPMRKGPFGVETLNQLIWEKMTLKLPSEGYLAIPIMIILNDYRQELFNGETGLLIRKLPLQSISSDDYALFPSRQANGEVRRLSSLLLPKYELAYCLSVHKSQGSEFDRILLVFPEGSEKFGREVLYTAVTRARKSIEIYGTDQVIMDAVKLKGVRLSGIEKRLTESL